MGESLVRVEEGFCIVAGRGSSASEFHPESSEENTVQECRIDRIEIERTRDEVRVMLFVARPGLIIGKKGQEIEILQAELQNLIGRRINLKVEEVGRPELQAQLVALEIAQQLSKRSSFRRTMKRTLETTMDAGAKGIKIQLAGRLGGAEMAREKSRVQARFH